MESFDTITANMYPWKRYAENKQLETMLVLFADTKKAHARVGDPQEIQRYLDYAEDNQASFDWVQLHSGFWFNHAPLKNYPDAGIEVDEETNSFVDKVIRLCKGKGKKVSYMLGNFTPLDQLLKAYPQVRNLNNGLFWQLLYDAAYGILTRFPQLDELSLYFFESMNLIHYNNFFKCMNYGLDIDEEMMEKHPDQILKQESQSWPYLSFADHLRMVLMAVASACRDLGKSFCLLTHVWFPYQEELLYEALKDFPADLPLILEHNYTTGDFNPYLPAPRLIERLPHLKHAVCYCCGMEYYGLSLIPCCFPEALQANLNYALKSSPNMERIVVRPIWDGESLLKTPNEVNLFALLKLAGHPGADTEELWDEWINSRYGISDRYICEELASILRASYQAVKQVLFGCGVRMTDHSHIPDYGHLESRLYNYGKALIGWRPDPENQQAVYDLLIRPGRKALRINRENHENSLTLMREAAGRLDHLREYLKAEDYEDISGRYRDFICFIQLHQLELDAYLRLRRYQKVKEPENREVIEQDINRLEEYRADILSGKIPPCYLFSPDHIGSFTESVRGQITGAPSGQFR